MLASFSVPLFFTVALTLCMLWVIVSDASTYIISNRVNGIILGLFVLAAVLLKLPAAPALGAALIVLAIGFGLFALGLMGGGDIKLLVALSFWTGWSMATPQFIFATAIFGGVLALIILPARVLLPGLWQKLRPGKKLPRLLTKKEPIPYGLAIATAFLALLWTGQVVGLPV